ncbi:MAG: hypothetical protein MPL62_09630 [Alphaproteobacteria bacterium]|nr:hypothetical protein [Alphaproteobacteria bacterium]
MNYEVILLDDYSEQMMPSLMYLSDFVESDSPFDFGDFPPARKAVFTTLQSALEFQTAIYIYEKY